MGRLGSRGDLTTGPRPTNEPMRHRRWPTRYYRVASDRPLEEG